MKPIHELVLTFLQSMVYNHKRGALLMWAWLSVNSAEHVFDRL